MVMLKKQRLLYWAPKAEITGEAAPYYPLNDLMKQFEIDMPGAESDFISVSGAGDKGGLIKFSGKYEDTLSNLESVTYSLSTGEKVHQGSFTGKGPFQRIFAAVTPLHYVLFGDGWLKLFYALTALAACGLIVSGNMLWLLRRGHGLEHWLSKLTLGACGGLVVATGTSFAASQILYTLVEAAEHHHWEEIVFWSSWGIVTVIPFVIRPGITFSHWVMRITAACFATTVIADGLVHGRWPWNSEGWVLNIQLGLIFFTALLIYLDFRMPRTLNLRNPASRTLRRERRNRRCGSSILESFITTEEVKAFSARIKRGLLQGRGNSRHSRLFRMRNGQRDCYSALP